MKNQSRAPKGPRFQMEDEVLVHLTHRGMRAVLATQVLVVVPHRYANRKRPRYLLTACGEQFFAEKELLGAGVGELVPDATTILEDYLLEGHGVTISRDDERFDDDKDVERVTDLTIPLLYLGCCEYYVVAPGSARVVSPELLGVIFYPWNPKQAPQYIMKGYARLFPQRAVFKTSEEAELARRKRLKSGARKR